MGGIHIITMIGSSNIAVIMFLDNHIVYLLYMLVYMYILYINMCIYYI